MPFLKFSHGTEVKSCLWSWIRQLSKDMLEEQVIKKGGGERGAFSKVKTFWSKHQCGESGKTAVGRPIYLQRSVPQTATQHPQWALVPVCSLPVQFPALTPGNAAAGDAVCEPVHLLSRPERSSCSWTGPALGTEALQGMNQWIKDPSISPSLQLCLAEKQIHIFKKKKILSADPTFGKDPVPWIYTWP